MNIILEYLIRNLITKNFLKKPCNLFLEDTNNFKKLIVTLEDDKDEKNIIIVKQHWISDTEQKKIFYIKKDDIFKDKNVIVSGMKPIEYQEQIIKKDSNSYNHPIEQKDFELIFKNFLNSVVHQSYKKDWLWDGFTALYFEGLVMPDKMLLPILERRYLIEQEKKYIKTNHPNHWQKWKKWLYEFIKEEEIATELVFLPYF